MQVGSQVPLDGLAPLAVRQQARAQHAPHGVQEGSGQGLGVDDPAVHSLQAHELDKVISKRRTCKDTANALHH